MKNYNYLPIDRNKIEQLFKGLELNKGDVSLQMGKSVNYLHKAFQAEKIDPLAMSYLKNEYGIEYADVQKDESDKDSTIDYDALAEALLTALEERLSEKGTFYQTVRTLLSSAQYGAMAHLLDAKNDDISKLLFGAVNGAMKYNGITNK